MMASEPLARPPPEFARESYQLTSAMSSTSTACQSQLQWAVKPKSEPPITSYCLDPGALFADGRLGVAHNRRRNSIAEPSGCSAKEGLSVAQDRTAIGVIRHYDQKFLPGWQAIFLATLEEPAEPQTWLLTRRIAYYRLFSLEGLECAGC